MAMGKHYGAFAKGFMDSLLAVYKLSMTRDLYLARENYYNRKGYGKPGTGINDPELGKVMNDARNSPLGGGDGGAAVSKNLAANQTEAYNAARGEGLNDSSARALVANMSGEALSDPGNVHWDGSHNAHGIVQWDDQRAGAIAKQFGTSPEKMSVADQTKAAIWEMKTNPAYKASWDALNSDGEVAPKIRTLVANYERPGDTEKAVGQRLAFAGRLPTTFAGEPKTETAAATTPTKGPNKGKPPKTDTTTVAAPAKPTPAPDTIASRDGSYQVAGDAGPVSAEAAARQKADLEAHRAQPDARPPTADPASAGAGPAPPPGSAIPTDLASDQGPGPGPAQPPPGTESPGTQFARPDAPVSTRGLPPAPTPAPVLGPATRADDGSRPDLTARVATTQMGPEAGAPVSPAMTNMPYPGQTDPKGVYAPKPTARSSATASEADKPAPNAQPVSSSAPPSNPADNTGDAAGTVRYEVPNSSAARAPIITAADLSHLWGPNPPLAQQAAAPAPPPPRLQDQQFDVGTPNMDDASLGMAIASAKGGAIPQRPAMGFAGGGATGGLSGNVLAADQYMTGLPGMAPVDLTQTAPGYYSAYGAGSVNGAGGQALTADWSKMTPAQLSQYNAMIAGTYQAPAATPAPTPAPAAVAPATVAPTSQTITAPAATTTITDPTTTTTTGAPSLPNSITAKSYDPNVDAQTGAGFANTSNTGGTNYSVGTDDLLQQNAQGQISGNGSTILSAKGGAIPSRPAMKYAAGGGAATSTLLSPDYSGPTAGGGWAGTAYADMAPNQQAWATNQQTLLGQEKANANNPAWAGWSQLSGTPAAIWPAATPTAPTPLNEPAPAASTTVSPSASSTIIDPTTTTTTGAPGLPNSIQAKSYDPNVDAQTGAGFANTSNTGGTNYSVGTDDLLQQNAQGQISGSDPNNTTILSRKGGSIPKLTPRVTRRVNRYDDGGGVSPSAAGMPPGLGSQQQAIPPIYFNPATYAGAGAPVGKGITQNSATTFNAGAIPSLPMARGGVVAFDDGGGVGIDPDVQQFDMEDMREGAEPAAPVTPAVTYNSAGEPTSDINPADYMPSAAPTSAPTTGGTDHIPPPDPTTPQIHDDAGNPSKGLIAAIGDGLHWLGDHLQLTGGAQAAPLASNPQTQTNRMNFSNGQNVGDMTPKDYEELNRIADPGGQLKNGYQNLAGLEAGYKWALSKGDAATAGKLAAAYLHYSVNLSQNLSGEAQKALYAGDLQKSVDYTNQALQAVPDGRNIHVELSPDGRTVKVTGSSLTGQQLWQKYGAAPELLERASALGKSGKLQWDALESQAAKYDSTFAGMQKARIANGIAQGKEDTANASAERVAATGAGNPLQPVTRVGDAAPTPALPGPGTNANVGQRTDTTPAVTPAAATSPTTGAPPSPNSAGAAQPNAAPQGADSNATYQPSNLGGAPTQAGPAIPPQATPIPSANVPAAQGQDVSFEDIAHRIDGQEIQANNSDLAKIQGKYFTPQGNILYGGQEYARPPLHDMTGLNKAEQQQAVQDYTKGPLAQYNAMVKANQDAMNKEVADNKDIRSKQFQFMRDQAGRQFTESQANTRAAQIDARTSQRAVDQSKRDAILNSQKDALDKSNAVFKSNLAGSTPRSDQEMNSLAGEGKTYDPAVMIARAFNPDLSEDTNRTTAMNDLKQKGFDANTQGVLANAWHNTVRNSHGVDPEEVGPAMQSFITGGQFTATAEAVDANGRPAAQHGDVRYALTVEDNSGNHISMLMSQNDLANLRNLRYQYSRQQGANLADTISRKGVLGSMGYGEPGLPPTSIPAWQQRTPAEQTQAPPF